MHLHVESPGTADGKPQRGSSEAALASARWDRRETEDLGWAEGVSALFPVTSGQFCNSSVVFWDIYYSKLMKSLIDSKTPCCQCEPGSSAWTEAAHVWLWKAETGGSEERREAAEASVSQPLMLKSHIHHLLME